MSADGTCNHTSAQTEKVAGHGLRAQREAAGGHETRQRKGGKMSPSLRRLSNHDRALRSVHLGAVHIDQVSGPCMIQFRTVECRLLVEPPSTSRLLAYGWWHASTWRRGQERRPPSVKEAGVRLRIQIETRRLSSGFPWRHLSSGSACRRIQDGQKKIRDRARKGPGHRLSESHVGGRIRCAYMTQVPCQQVSQTSCI